MPLEVTMAESSDSYLHEPDEWIGGEIVDVQVAPDKGYGPGFKWIIELDDAEEGDFDTWAFCSQIFAPKSKLYGWIAALEPDNIPTPGTKVDVEKYIGWDCQVMFERFKKEDGTTGERVAKIRAAKGAVTRKPSEMQKKQTETKAARSTKRETTDFASDEAPF